MYPHSMPLTPCLDVQTQKRTGLYAICAPSEAAKLVSASFQEGHLTLMWSNGFLQAVNTELQSSTVGSDLNIHITRRLSAFDLGPEPMLIDTEQSQCQDEKQQQQPAGKKKKRKSSVAADCVPAGKLVSTGLVHMLVPLGGHSVAALREPVEAHTNGHQSSDVEITVAETQYGCVQSVTSVKLPGVAASRRNSAELHGMQHEAFQLHSGIGNLVLLMRNAVWYISVQVKPLLEACTSAVRRTQCCGIQFLHLHLAHKELLVSSCPILPLSLLSSFQPVHGVACIAPDHIA